MKKLLLFAAVSALSFGAFAQGNSGKNKKSEGRHERNENENEDSDHDHKKGNKNKNADYENNDRTERRTGGIFGNNTNTNTNDNGKYSKNTPRKVGDAFRNDYPNATNVSWTKSQGVWTAHFGGGGILGNAGNRTASYKANGQRVGQTRSRNGIFN